MDVNRSNKQQKACKDESSSDTVAVFKWGDANAAFVLCPKTDRPRRAIAYHDTPLQ